MRFNELLERLKGINPKGISDALSNIQGIGLVEYRLTRDGGQFREAVVPLIRWAADREGWDSKCCPATCERHDAAERSQHHAK